ncbi:transposase [Streptomyces sp. NPDC002952]|uniref:transposase n=1 Tax=Streptomyces sp. NPDC002952 TaxID=3364673 RepID=UPI003678FBF5
MIDAITFKSQTGSQWVHLPEKYENWRGVYNRLRIWAVDGPWERVFIALVAQVDANEDVSWAVSVGSTIVRAHQHAAGARKRGTGQRAGRPRHRPVPLRTGHQDPHRGPWPVPAAGVRPYRRSGRKRSRLHGGHGPPARSPATRTAPHQAGPGPGRQAYSSRAIRDHLRRRGIRAGKHLSASATRPFPGSGHGGRGRRGRGRRALSEREGVGARTH